MIRLHGHRAFLPTICAFALFLTYGAAKYTQANITNTPGYKLLPGISSVPAPLALTADQEWVGIDGSWNTFTLLLGEPQHKVQVLISTSSEQTWAVHRQACLANSTTSSTNQTQSNDVNNDCEVSRGGLFNPAQSTTWHQKGYYQLWLEQTLGFAGNGLYGFDSVGFGLAGGDGPVILNSTLGTLITPNYWLGHIGLHPNPTNFSAVDDPVPSFLKRLFSQQNIPSLSFGYTAGAKYRGRIVCSSLTLGGYDASRLIPNNLTFTFAPNNQRDLVVGVVGLTTNLTTKSGINLLKRDDVNMFIDSTVAELWLPVEICQAFEDTFGLKHDNKTGLYLVDDALHQSLLTQNPSITFTLGQKYSTQNIVQITLPYAAFDLEALPPYQGLQTKSKYFPIRRGSNESQWVLGRTFLQEAYLTVDWERQNFSLSAVDWTYGKPVELLPIVSHLYAKLQNNPSQTQGLSNGAIAGIAVGGGFVLALGISVVGLWFWRRRQRHKLEMLKAKYEAEAAAIIAKDALEKSEDPPLSPSQASESGTKVFPKAELHGTSAVHHELSSSTDEKDAATINEADNTEREIYEMAGDIPQPQESGGRQLSEKETMVVRERRYNGVDPNGPADVSPTVPPPPRCPPISASEVTIVNQRVPTNNNLSPVSPRTPNARDGAFLEANDTFFQPPPYRPPRDGRAFDDNFLSPISPVEASTDTSRRRFSYET